MADNSLTIAGKIFNIQRYSIHDGPGIRTTVFLKGCPLKCYWCQNPESQRAKSEVFLDKSKCTRCGKCIAACTKGATTLGEGSSAVNRKLCDGCGNCVKVCPNGARTLVGREITVEDTLRELRKDAKFYENSGGGITLSGGEPTAQPEFSLALLERGHELGLHTAVETCGYARWEILQKFLKLTDLVLYDIKHMDPAKHREGTGVSNRLILENARKAARITHMMVRVPIIPGFNDSPDDIYAIAHFVRAELGGLEIELLPFNSWAGTKYERLDRPYTPAQPLSEEAMTALQEIAGTETVPGTKRT